MGASLKENRLAGKTALFITAGRGICTASVQAMADEIASLVVNLAADKSAFTTGQAHIIDGGW